MGTEYKVGDRVRIVHTDYDGCGLDVGTVHKVASLYGKGVHLFGVDDEGLKMELYFRSDEIEPAPSIIDKLSFDVDMPTADMKEFADHCERAAAALERIKEMLK